MAFTFYEVGGKVRDEILGIQSKDVDYVAVPKDSLLEIYKDANEMFKVLDEYLIAEKFEVFLKTPDCFTIRAMFPPGHQYKGVADFVMARKEIGYIEGTRTPIVVPGTLEDDLSRRDFTLNALAKNHDGKIIDLFNGQGDLKSKILRTPLDPMVTMMDDPLRILRALRFSITKGFTIHYTIWEALHQPELIQKLRETVSQERIRDELFKMLKNDTKRTLKLIHDVDEHHMKGLYDVLFDNGMWIKPTFEK